MRRYTPEKDNRFRQGYDDGLKGKGSIVAALRWRWGFICWHSMTFKTYLWGLKAGRHVAEVEAQEDKP